MLKIQEFHGAMPLDPTGALPLDPSAAFEGLQSPPPPPKTPPLDSAL